jgi:hypothetical protein
VGYEILRNLEAIAGGEFNSNDDFKSDFRGTLALKFSFN